MFTGIIEEVGRVKEIVSKGNLISLTIEANLVTKEVQTGDSIATNGVCLTIVRLGTSFFTADVMEESIQRTNLSKLQPGDRVNLEHAMKINSRFDGHIVQGHVDGVGKIINISKEKGNITYRMTSTPKLLHQLVEKGSISLDGISLTLSKVTDTYFEVSLIPTTMRETNLIDRKVSDLIHIETDIIGKYIEKFLQQKESSIDYDFLTRCGF